MTTWGDPQRDEVQEYAERAAGPDGKPRQCITRISIPRSAASILQRLHSRIKEPPTKEEPNEP